MTTSEQHPWLEEGETVAVIVSGWYPRVDFRTVEKVGKRDIVLTDGTRWSTTHLGPSGNRYGSGRLADPNSQEVGDLQKELMSRQAVSKVRNAIARADEKLSRHPAVGFDSIREAVAEMEKQIATALEEAQR